MMSIIDLSKSDITLIITNQVKRLWKKLYPLHYCWLQSLLKMSEFNILGRKETLSNSISESAMLLECGHVIQEIRHLLRTFQQWQISCIHRR